MQVHLLSIPYLSLDYSNVIDFQDVNSRQTFFTNNTLKTVESNIKYDGERSYMIIEEKIEDCLLYDYLYFVDSSNKPWYYFITNIVQETKNHTRLILTLDIWMTYMFRYEILPSFVDRCHVSRWNGDIPTFNIENEDLEIGEYVQIGPPEDIYTMEKSVIITSSVPMGKVYKPPTSIGGGGGTGGGTSWQDGKVSSRGFRFLKGFEGFAPVPYQDSGGYWTIAYGVTLHGESAIYNDLVADSPITEEQGARVSYDLKNKNYASRILENVKLLGCTTQYQFDALTSLAYNCGTGVVTGSNSLMNAIALDPTDESTIRPIWESFYITSGGQTLPGLIARRKEECNMFFNKPFEIRAIAKINSSGGISGTVTENNGDGWLPDDSAGSVDGYKSFSNSYGDNWLCPVKGGEVRSKYGWRIHPLTGVSTFHHGTDIGVSEGVPSVSSKDGIVLQTGWQNPNNHDEGFGLRVWVQHGDYKIVHGHLSSITVSEGQTVKRGQEIGKVGSTGASSGPHCHWEIRRISDNKSVDVAPILKVGDKV